MANDKRFVAKNGLQTQNILFIDSAAGLNQILMRLLDSDVLSFEGDAGQLFSLSDTMDGTIFSVNDVSGIPSIEVDDDGIIRLAEFTGNVLVGTDSDDGSKFQITGSLRGDSATFDGPLVTSGDILPNVDNTGNLGTALKTWNQGYFTNMVVDGTLTVRTAIDLADNDTIRFGTSDDFWMAFNGTDALMELEGGVTNFKITDNGTDRFTFAKSTGILTATSFNGALTGNASTASAWATGRTITLTGDVTGTSAAWTGSGNISFAATVGNDTHTHGAGNLTGTTLAAGVTASSLTSVGSLVNGTIVGPTTITNSFSSPAAGKSILSTTAIDGIIISGQGSTTDIILANKTGSTVFSVATGTTTASFVGLALGGHTMNDIDITSEYSGADDHLMTSAAINARILDFGYTGNQTAGVGLSGTTTLALDLGELTAGGTLIAGDYLIAENGGADHRQLISSIPLSIFNNDSLWTSNVGTVTSVAAGNGLNFTSITGSGSVTMGTPGTLTGSTSNGVTATSHTHAITTTGTGDIVAAVSPALTGTPTAPTAGAGTNTTQIATTAYVQGEIAASGGGTMSSFNVQSNGGTQVVVSDAEELNFINGTNTTATVTNQTNPTVQIDADDTNLTWTAGTTAGPTVNSSTGANAVIPSASDSASGAVTTGTQTFAGAKTFTDNLSVGGNVYVTGSLEVDSGIIGRATTDTFTLNGQTQPNYGFNLNAAVGVPSGISGYRGLAFATSATERMLIDAAGAVTIHEDLDVTGEVSANNVMNSWSIKTTAYTAVKNDQVLVNSAAALTITLPSSPSPEDTIIVSNAGAGEVTIARSGENINSLAEDGTLPSGNSIQIVYVDATVGWFEV